MKLTLDTLPQHLAGDLLPAYLVSGDEPLLVGETVDAIRARARAVGFEEREVFAIERGSAIWEAALQAAQSLSLFAARRIIEVRMPNGKPGTAGAAALQRLFETPGADLLILVVTNKLDRDSQDAPWVQALQARGAWVPIWPVERARLPQWLRARFAQAGLSPEEDALALLADQSEGNLLAARQEIDKLALLLPKGARVRLADVAAGGADSARFDVFQLGQAVRARDATRALRILGGLRAEGAEPVLVLWSLVRELRALQGTGPSGLQARRPPYARLAARAGRADRMAKGLRAGNVWDELALLAVELTGKRTLPLVAALA